MASLQERLDEFKKSFESGAPPYNAPHEAIETMHRATAELKATGIEGRTLKVGDRAPAFTLFNQDHVEVSSADLLRQGPLVVTFFRAFGSTLDRFNDEPEYRLPIRPDPAQTLKHLRALSV